MHRGCVQLEGALSEKYFSLNKVVVKYTFMFQMIKCSILLKYMFHAGDYVLHIIRIHVPGDYVFHIIKIHVTGDYVFYIIKIHVTGDYVLNNYYSEKNILRN